MSRNAVRVGEAIIPDITTAGSPGASDQVRTFKESAQVRAARPVIVTNMDGSDVLYVLPNGIDCSPTNFMVKLAAGQAVDLSVEGQVAITSVSMYYATAAYSQAQVRGWYP